MFGHRRADNGEAADEALGEDQEGARHEDEHGRHPLVELGEQRRLVETQRVDRRR